MLVRMSREFTLSSDVPFRLVSLKSSVVSSAQHFMHAFAQPRYLMMRRLFGMHRA